MCEYVPAGNDAKDLMMGIGDEFNVGGKVINSLGMSEDEDTYWACWHPETDSWEAMLPPPEGMGLYMSPGSKIKLCPGVAPEHTKNLPHDCEVVPVGTQMRDLIKG